MRAETVRKLALLLVFTILIIAAALVYLYIDRAGEQPRFRLAQVKRGPIISTVSSSGTLNAVITVQVGSQVSGQIKELLADFNSEVRAGQVIARIDPENLEARVRQAEAELEVARANVAIQRATVERARAELESTQAALAAAKAQTDKATVTVTDAKRDLDRNQVLHKGAVIAVASVSLLVGGIGIMNIMLVSVTERTREIGLRMAVGAQSRDILAQFLIESVTLSLIGVILGLSGSVVIATLGEWPTIIEIESVILAFGFSAAVGVFFGFYPARKAACLDPIEALRYE